MDQGKATTEAGTATAPPAGEPGAAVAAPKPPAASKAPAKPAAKPTAKPATKPKAPPTLFSSFLEGLTSASLPAVAAMAALVLGFCAESVLPPVASAATWAVERLFKVYDVIGPVVSWPARTRTARASAGRVTPG